MDHIVLKSLLRRGLHKRVDKPGVEIHREMWPLLLHAACGHNGQIALLCSLTDLLERQIAEAHKGHPSTPM
jgi:hypothetical protein